MRKKNRIISKIRNLSEKNNKLERILRINFQNVKVYDSIDPNYKT